MSKPAEIEAHGRSRRPRARRASTSWSTMPASSTSRRSSNSRRSNGTRSSRSTCRPPSTPSGSRCRRCSSATGAASSISRARTAWSRACDKVAYVAAKHGLVGLTKVVALETAQDRRHLQRDLSRLGAHAAGAEADRGARQARRHPGREGASSICSPRSSRRSNSSRRSSSAGSRCSCARRRRHRSAGTALADAMAAGPRNKRIARSTPHCARATNA